MTTEKTTFAAIEKVREFFSEKIPILIETGAWHNAYLEALPSDDAVSKQRQYLCLDSIWGTLRAGVVISHGEKDTLEIMSQVIDEWGKVQHQFTNRDVSYDDLSRKTREEAMAVYFWLKGYSHRYAK